MSPVLAALCSAPADRCALLDASGSLSFDELRRTVYALQKALLHTGASRAALMADNGRAWVAADLAMLASGIVSIPLPTYFSDAQIFHVLNDAGIDCVLTDDPARLLRIEQAFEPGIADASGLTLLRRALRAPAALPAGTAKITYTSGSTGAPKGVCLPQIAIDEVVGALHASTQSAGMSRHLALLPLPTLLENIASIYVPLLSGATMCMPASRHTGVGFGGIDSRQLTACIDRYRPESLVVVPEVLRSLMRQVLRGWRPARLRFIAVGGAHVR